MDNSLLLSWVFLTLSRGQSYLEAAVTSWSDDFIQIGHKNAHVLCIRKCPQTTNPLNTLVGHMGIGWVFPGEMGWGCQTCATWGGDLAGLRVSPALPGWVRKFSLDTEESSPSVRVQRMRKRAGLSTLCPSLALIMEKNFFFFKESNCDLKHAKQCSLFNKHFAYCHKQYRFATVIYVRTRCVDDSVYCGHSLSRWGIPTSSVGEKAA